MPCSTTLALQKAQLHSARSQSHTLLYTDTTPSTTSCLPAGRAQLAGVHNLQSRCARFSSSLPVGVDELLLPPTTPPLDDGAVLCQHPYPLLDLQPSSSNPLPVRLLRNTQAWCSVMHAAMQFTVCMDSRVWVYAAVGGEGVSCRGDCCCPLTAFCALLLLAVQPARGACTPWGTACGRTA